MKAELWFYKGPARLFDRLIRFCTGSRYSHVEIVINSMAYGADAWTGRVRCRFVGGFNPDHWDAVAVECRQTLTWLGQQLDKRYDWLGIFGFACFGVQDMSRWYCSGLCARAIGDATNPISPGKLYEIVTGRQNV